MVLTKKIRSIIAVLLLLFLVGSGRTAVLAEEMTLGDEDGDSLISYAETFNGADMVLNIDGMHLDTITLLRQFSFRSLELKILYPDEESAKRASTPRTLLFPDETGKVTVFCGAEEKIPATEAMGQLIASLQVCCPEAELNGQPVSEMAAYAQTADSYGAYPYYKTGYAMHLLYDQALRGELPEISEEPVYHGKLLFLVMGEGELLSAESLLFGESFYGASDAFLATRYEEADMAVFLYPEYGLLGYYSNGGEARCTCTRVLAVDLAKQEMYAPYTAVKKDPPEDLPISVENGVYATNGADGAFAPEEAVKMIMAKVEAKARTEKKSTEKAASETETASETGTDPEATTVSEATAASEETTVSQSAAAPGTEGETPQQNEEQQAAEPEGQTAPENETTAGNLPEGQTETENEIVVRRDEGTRPEDPTTAKDNRVLGSGNYSWLDEERLDQILDALDDPVYRETYEMLKKNKDLVYGSKGKPALAVQNTLIAFDREIAADSSVGNATLGALNDIQEAFGQEQTSKINSGIYAMLMPCLLVYQNPEAAWEILADIEEKEPGLFSYLQACLLYLQGSCYRAMLLFEESQYGDYEIRLPHCIQDMPDTGEIYRNSGIKGNDATLHIRVNSAEEAGAVCVRIFTEAEELIAVLLVRGTGEAQTALPAGRYHIMDGSGYRWYGIQDLFGEDGRYSSMIFEDGTDQVSLLSGFDYTITFNGMEHDAAASSIGIQQLEWEGIVAD